jgi:type II secretion system protein N
MKIPSLSLHPRLLYGLFAVAAFVVSLRWTFPSEAVKERLIYEAGARGWQIDVQRVRLSALLGVRMDGVALTDSSGLKIPVERLDASLQLLPLLVGRRVLDYEASLYDGTIEGSAALSGQQRRMRVNVDGVNLARALPLRNAAGMDLAGKVAGRIDLTLPGGSLERSSGTFELSIEKAGLGGGQLPALMNLTLPPIALGTVSAAAKVDQGRVAVEKLEAKGGDAELTGEGIAVVLQPRMQYAPIAGQARVRFQPTLWQKPGAAPLRPVVEAGLMSSRGPDGSYIFQLSGSLGHPQARPTGFGGGAPAPSATISPAPPPGTPPASAPPPPTRSGDGGD